MIPNVKIVGDSAVALGGATTGTYMNKGTATDAVITLVVTTAATGTTTAILEGNNTGSGAGTAVTPDKSGTGAAALLAGGTLAVGTYQFHLAQLQFQFYRVRTTGGTGGVGTVTGQFYQLQDSFDNTIN